MRLPVSDHDKSCRAVKISNATKASADGAVLQFVFGSSFFRGIVFGQWEYEKQLGLDITVPLLVYSIDSRAAITKGHETFMFHRPLVLKM